MADNAQTGFYDIVKLCKGGLVLDLPAFDSSSINRVVRISHDVQKVRVPRTYALGVFLDPTLERMYKQGYFKVEPVTTFEKDAATVFMPVEDKMVVATEEQIKTALLKNNRVTIKKLIEENDVNKHNIIIIARELIGDLSTSMIKDLETILGVELTVENE